MRTNAKDPRPMTMTAMAQSGSPESSVVSVAGAENSLGTTIKQILDKNRQSGIGKSLIYFYHKSL